MNSEKKERREAQLAKKAETIRAFASEIIVQSPTRILIDSHPYVIEENYRNGFNVEKLKERFSDILTKYDYIVGDWGYDQLRLRGFYAKNSTKGTPAQNIERLQDYLYEYCNFGCAYFVLRNLDVQTPPESVNNQKNKKTNNRKNINKRRPKTNKPYTSQRVYDINKKQQKHKEYATKHVKKRKRHFTIRQTNK